MKNDIVAVMLSVICMVLCVTLVIGVAQYMNLSDRLAKTERKYDELERKVERHDEIMLTYEFFNEKWTSAMKGER